MKPHLICHMAGSLDGRILPDRWTPKTHSHKVYEAMHGELGGGSWLVGRVTGQEFAKRESYVANDSAIDRKPWLPIRDARAYGIVLDAGGKIAWGRNDIDGDPIIVVLSEAVTDSHLAGLRADGVGYLFAGKREIDLALALEWLNELLGVEHLLLEGGGVINGAFLRAGLIDEISLLIEPVIDGRAGAPSIFDGEANAGTPPLTALELIEHRLLDGGILWARYRVSHD